MLKVVSLSSLITGGATVLSRSCGNLLEFVTGDMMFLKLFNSFCQGQMCLPVSMISESSFAWVSNPFVILIFFIIELLDYLPTFCRLLLHKGLLASLSYVKTYFLFLTCNNASPKRWTHVKFRKLIQEFR